MYLRIRNCKPCQKRAWHDGPSSRLINGRLACDGEEPCNNCQSIIRLHEPCVYSEPQSALLSQHERHDQATHGEQAHGERLRLSLEADITEADRRSQAGETPPPTEAEEFAAMVDLLVAGEGNEASGNEGEVGVAAEDDNTDVKMEDAA